MSRKHLPWVAMPLLVGATLAHAAGWPSDPLVNLPVCTAANEQTYPTIVSDGAAGAIVTWQDYRNGADYSIYAQHVLASGDVDPAWPSDGRGICLAAGHQERPTIVSDGGGGAIITWMDYRTNLDYEVFAQHVRANGTVDPAWPVNGCAVCTASDNQTYPMIVADGVGGAIVTWMDSRFGYYESDIYAQHVRANGTVDPAWPYNGRALCAAAGMQSSPTIVADGAGGAIATWQDRRDGIDRTYAQRIQASGTLATGWPADGRLLCTSATTQYYPMIVGDGSGGAIVTWMDYRDSDMGYQWDIYAQHVLASSLVDPGWPDIGRAVCAVERDQKVPMIAADGAGGAIVTWQDGRNNNPDIYAQHVLASGAIDPAWPDSARALCIADGTQMNPTIVADGAGGAIVTWQDHRDGSTYDVYSQRVLANGAVNLAWPPDGRVVCSAASNQEYPTIITDLAGGAIVTWTDLRSTGGRDIYAQRVKSNGQLGGGTVSVPRESYPALVLEPIRPNPAPRGALSVHFTLGNSAAASLEILDVSGRQLFVSDVSWLRAGPHVRTLGEGAHIAPGVYFVCLRQGANVRTMRVAVLD